MNPINKSWQLQTAKNKFSEMVNLALAGEPQLVTRNARPAVYIVSAASFEKSRHRKNKSLRDLLKNSPCKDVELKVSREKNDTGRKVEL